MTDKGTRTARRPATAKAAAKATSASKAAKSVRTVDEATADLQPATTAVQRCVEAIRTLIFVGEFLPGQPLRQSQLAERLKTSRIPVREALSILETEGVVSYVPHVGHTVARLDVNQLQEIYTLRGLIETEVVRSIDLAQVDVARLEAFNAELEEASNELDVDRVTRINVQFHFFLFEYSPYKLMLAELRRLWNMSGFYRAVQVYDQQHRKEIIEEHNRMIEAVRAQDMDELLAAWEAHRSWRQTGNFYALTRIPG